MAAALEDDGAPIAPPNMPDLPPGIARSISIDIPKPLADDEDNDDGGKEKKKKTGEFGLTSSCIATYVGIGDDTNGNFRTTIELLVWALSDSNVIAGGITHDMLRRVSLRCERSLWPLPFTCKTTKSIVAK